MSGQHSDGDEQFLRELIFAEEDRQTHTSEKWTGGFRWFRSPNVICIEQYFRSPAEPISKSKPAA